MSAIPVSAWEALEEAESAETRNDIRDAHRFLLRALRLTAGEDGYERTRARAAYISLLIRQHRSDAAIGMLRDLLHETGGSEIALKPLWELLSKSSEREAVAALPYLNLDHAITPWELLRASEVFAKVERYRLGKALAELVRESAAQKGDDLNRWRAEGQLGRVFERAGKIEKAVELWWRAFREGSPNRVTADRLSLYLERTKQYATCSTMLRQALTRICDPRSITLLRQRLARVEAKQAKRPVARTAR